MEGGSEAAAGTPVEAENPSTGAGGACKPPEEMPTPLNERTWDEWLDRQVVRITECLGTREAWELPPAALADLVGVNVYGTPGQPYRFVEFGPVAPPWGSLKYSNYWVQWQEPDGTVRVQELHPMDAGPYRGHRVHHVDSKGPLLLFLLQSTLDPHGGSIWAWRLQEGAWRPDTEAFAGIEWQEWANLALDPGEENGLGVGNSSLYQHPYLGFRDDLEQPHVVICPVSEEGQIMDCRKLLWVDGRFQLDQREGWPAELRPMRCEALAVEGADDLHLREPAWVADRLGRPAAERAEEDSAEWEYPDRGLTIRFRDGQVVRQTITQGGLRSGLRVGDSLERALTLHGRPEELPDGQLVWAYPDCDRAVLVVLSGGRITRISLSSPSAVPRGVWEWD
ncbi:MAG: hypothetical protein AB2385_16455 [Symbiobacterium sp.]|uniref:hypothetical protein n=1 Tax=Symbiobacterium sp. TaxID=1971213 RepID=UPI0034645C02